MKVGDIVGFRYQIKGLLGRGSYSEVWSAINMHTRAEYAVKTAIVSDENTSSQLANERLILSTLSRCDNIITLHSHFSSGDRLFLMLDKAETSLDKLVDFKDMSGLIDIFEALTFMHSRSILHRDVKPANVLVVKNNKLVLCDFGLSGPPVLTPKVTKNLVGTIQFASKRVTSLRQNTAFDDIESFLYTAIDVLHYHGSCSCVYSDMKLSTDELPGELVAAVSYIRLPEDRLPDPSSVGFVKRQLQIFSERKGTDYLI